jgi:hypothetical protein
MFPWRQFGKQTKSPEKNSWKLSFSLEQLSETTKKDLPLIIRVWSSLGRGVRWPKRACQVGGTTFRKTFKSFLFLLMHDTRVSSKKTIIIQFWFLFLSKLFFQRRKPVPNHFFHRYLRRWRNQFWAGNCFNIEMRVKCLLALWHLWIWVKLFLIAISIQNYCLSLDLLWLYKLPFENSPFLKLPRLRNNPHNIQICSSLISKTAKIKALIY